MREFALQVRWVLCERSFASRRARARAFWHYIIRRWPLEICTDCGRPVGRATGPSWWHADNELWLEVNGTYEGVLCPPCFTVRALAKSILVYWSPVVDTRPAKL